MGNSSGRHEVRAKYGMEIFEYLECAETRTLSGLDAMEIPALNRGHYSAFSHDLYSHAFQEYFFMFESDLGGKEGLLRIINEANKHDCIGDFLADEVDDLPILAAFGLVLIDRITLLAREHPERGWDALRMMDGLCECQQYVQTALYSPADGMQVKRIITRRARDAAMAKLAKDPKQKAKVGVFKAWQEWQRRPHMFVSKSSFASDMMKNFPALSNQRVIVDWCGIWEKERGEANDGQ